jgi:large subunit ribosomal protein L21
MYAIIQTGGKQYKVEQGNVISVEKLGLEPGETVTFDQVLAISKGNEFKAGTPIVEGANVVGTVLANGRGKKIKIFKHKKRTGYRKRQGHRQAFTTVRIDSINA